MEGPALSLGGNRVSFILYSERQRHLKRDQCCKRNKTPYICYFSCSILRDGDFFWLTVWGCHPSWQARHGSRGVHGSGWSHCVHSQKAQTGTLVSCLPSPSVQDPVPWSDATHAQNDSPQLILPANTLLDTPRGMSAKQL